jgi:hypothetical protein
MKSTELRPIPTTSKGFSFGKERSNRMLLFTNFLVGFQALQDLNKDAEI